MRTPTHDQRMPGGAGADDLFLQVFPTGINLRNSNQVMIDTHHDVLFNETVGSAVKIELC